MDAGANIGLASIYFANQYPDTKIIAIEPEQSNFSVLQKNVVHYPNITPVQAALWHKNEKIYLFNPGLGKWTFMTKSKDEAKKNLKNICHAVNGVTADKLINDYKLNKIDILKTDIEGAEKEVFSNTSAWIHKIDALIVELHERMKPGCKKSFYTGLNGFDQEWKRGENTFLMRGDFIKKPSSSMKSL